MNRFAPDPEGVRREGIRQQVMFRRVCPGSYTARVGSRLIAEIDKTGTHLDNYPWGWVVALTLPRRANGLPGNTTGYEDTYRAAREAVRDAWLIHEETR